MRRILVDLRIFLATVAVLGVALALVSLAFLGIYNAPIEHIVTFYGAAYAKVENYSTIVRLQNFTESGIPRGALLGFRWVNSFGGSVAILALAGNNTSISTVAGCQENPGYEPSWGGCAWTAESPSFTVSIWYAYCPPSPSCSGNFTAVVGVQGWYSYSTPAQ